MACCCDKKPNVLLVAIDSLLSTHMSGYGYKHLTTPHMDKFAKGGVLFEQTFSPNVPTTPAYSCMLTGKDIFSNQVVALRHKGPLTDASASPATPRRAVSTSTWTIPPGVRRARTVAAPRPRTSMRSQCPRSSASRPRTSPSS
jgi:arylsulfatase A-like enzyme